MGEGNAAKGSQLVKKLRSGKREGASGDESLVGVWSRVKNESAGYLTFAGKALYRVSISQSRFYPRCYGRHEIELWSSRFFGLMIVSCETSPLPIHTARFNVSSSLF